MKIMTSLVRQCSLDSDQPTPSVCSTRHSVMLLSMLGFGNLWIYKYAAIKRVRMCTRLNSEYSDPLHWGIGFRVQPLYTHMSRCLKIGMTEKSVIDWRFWLSMFLDCTVLILTIFHLAFTTLTLTTVFSVPLARECYSYLL